jgi:hypothetical protein
MILSSIRPASHHRVKPAGDSAGQLRNRLFKRHTIVTPPRATVAGPGTARIRRRPVLGGLISEYTHGA